MSDVITNNLDLWTSALFTKSSAGRGSNGKQEAYGINKLRELILELAVRGKLVPQVPNDEPASVLLQRIGKAKARLVKEGELKKEESPPAIGEDEKAFALPNGWEWSRLQIVSTYVQRGKGPQYADYGKVRVVSQKCVQWSGFDLSQARYIDDASIEGYQPERFLRKDDLLWNSTGTGTVGRINVVPEVEANSLVADSHVTIIRPLLVNSGFMRCYISAPGIQLRIEPEHENSLVSGTTKQVELNLSAVIQLAVPVPPFAEQNRIVAKVDELMTLCDELEQQQTHSIEAHKTLVETLLGTLTRAASPQELTEAWTRIANHFDTLFTTEHRIDQLKNTILQLAVMGKLVPQDPNDEPANVLLEKIAEEKETMVRAGTVKKEKSLSEISGDKMPFEVPKEWAWVRLGEIVFIRGGKRVSNGYKLLSTPTPHIYIRVSDMKDGSIDDSDLRYIDDEMYSKISQYIVTKHDVYMTIVGATIGKCGLVPDKLDGMNLTENAARLTPIIISKYYLYQTLSTAFCQDQFIDKTKQVGVQKMALIRLASTLFPLPPLAEQHRIVAKVDELMALCNALKARLADAQTTQIHLADAIVEQAVA